MPWSVRFSCRNKQQKNRESSWLRPISLSCSSWRQSWTIAMKMHCADVSYAVVSARTVRILSDYCHLVILIEILLLFISVRCNVYISRLCFDVRVRLSVTEVHWRIIANLGFKFRSPFTVHRGRHAACRRCAACGRIISRHASQC